MKLQMFTLLLLLGGLSARAQHTVSGKVQDESGAPLIGVNVLERGTDNGTVTDVDGRYQLEVRNPEAVLSFSYTGYRTLEVEVAGKSEVDVVMQEGITLGEVQVVGSRSYKRSAVQTPVPVDIIDLESVTTRAGQVEINQILHYVAPSFNANKQSGSDGADHIDPATLRGLGPDQTLVLINGKRRHSSSLVNVFGTRGRGNTGTDLNAIPASAIERIEILRDGASAQYGSDAIAGVVNIVLKDDVGRLTGSVSVGAYNTNAPGDFPAGTPNTDGNRLDTSRDGNAIGEDENLDGESVKVTANYGVPVGDGGFVNVTTEYLTKNKTLRPGFDFRRGFGEAAIDGFSVFTNAVIPLGRKSEFYAFGGRNYRETDAFAFTRNNPTERNVLKIYPNGFTPRITSVITDNSVSAGVRTLTESGWTVDINNTYGINNFHYFIKGTLNASMQEASPTDFDAGGHLLSQNNTGIDFSKYYDEVLEGMNLAFGLEYRTENFQIFSGDDGSWGTFDVNGVLITNPAIQEVPIDPETGNPRPGGSQGFPGYSPANEVDRSRSNFALYADAEFDLSEAFLLSGAARFERYSDFGNTLNFKLASRYKISNDLALRASVSTGFRAPSLVQIYYNLRFTDFQSGVPSETLLSPNNSPVTQSFGIQPLKEETAVNVAGGFTFNRGNFTATIDGYLISVDDRIVLTGTFDASNLGINVAEAQFFANGVDTKTKGVDIILSYRAELGKGALNVGLAGNINDMEIDAINNGNLDAETFFGKREQAFLLASAPKSKFVLNLGYNVGDFGAQLAFTRYSDVTLVDFADNEDFYEAKLVTDLSLSYQLSDNLNLAIGANNLTNEYPSLQDDGETEAGGYWDAVQMGFSGAYYFARLGYKF
ncbi:MAG: TonB-dependent receptor [Bacteroidetes bacterium]|nr:MAG: TonB-dependent receptor [Bacteroidota bacterium]